MAGDIEGDLSRNYAEDVILLTGRGLFRGHDSVRQLARSLCAEVASRDYEYRTKLVDGEMAFLEWTVCSATARVEDGADSFWGRGGRIVAQTIHYTVQPR